MSYQVVAFPPNLWCYRGLKKGMTQKNYPQIHAPFFLFKTRKDQAAAKGQNRR
jgi:hypothetical protein